MSAPKRKKGPAGCIAGVLAVIVLALSAGLLFLLISLGPKLLGAVGNMETDEVPFVTQQPTMPPLEEEFYVPDETGQEWTDPVDVPIAATPEELAETAVDETPPPDAPIG